MSKKIVSVILVLAFVLFSESCTVYRTKTYSADGPARVPGPKSSVVRVLLKSGETREFGKKNPAHVINGAIVWTGPMVTVRSGGSIEVAREGGGYIIKTADGRTYRTSFYTRDGASGGLKYATQEIAPIPLSEVDMFWTRDVNKVLTILLWLPAFLYLVAAFSWSGVVLYPGPGL
jgi:hypothetical protein